MAGLLLLIGLVASWDSLLALWNRGAPPQRFLPQWHRTLQASPEAEPLLWALRWSWEISRRDPEAARRTFHRWFPQPGPAEALPLLETSLQDFFRAFRFHWPPESLSQWLQHIPREEPRNREVWWLYERGWQWARQGILDSAAALWARVVQQAPASPYARWLLNHVDSLLPLSPEDRGFALYRQGRYEEALPLLKDHLFSSRFVRAYLTCLYRLRRNLTFLREFHRLKARLSTSDRHRMAYYRAVVLDRLNRRAEAIQALIDLAKRSPRWRASAITYASLLALETNLITRTARELERRFPHTPVARARAALLHLVMNRPEAARRLFRKNLQASEFWRAQALYFLYRITQNPAFAETLRQEFPLSYYTARLSQPPKALHTTLKTSLEDSCPAPQGFRALARYFLNAQALAVPFAQQCPLRAALVADSVGNPGLALRLAHRHFQAQTSLDSLTLALLFPLPASWRPWLARLGLEDPWLFLGLMREESHFRPFVVSPAGAIGLSQVMPHTYRQLMPEGRPSDLFRPPINLRAGASVLQRELHAFGSPALALAAYNAGPRRVRNWLHLWQQRGIAQDEALWVEFIPFRETRNYVRRVYRSWKLYRWLYPRAF